MNELEILSIHLVATLLMVGIIWFVQLVHYQLMLYVRAADFRRYSQVNQSRTSFVVVGPMFVEALSAAALIGWCPNSTAAPAFVGSVLLLVVVWVSTAALQMPLHLALLGGFEEHLIQRLVRTNWLRTVAWTARSVLVGAVWFSAISRPA